MPAGMPAGISHLDLHCLHRYLYRHTGLNFRLALPCEDRSSGIFEQRRSRQACTSAQSDQGLHCPLTKSVDTTECMNGQQRPGCYFAHAQDDLNLRMFEGTFSLDVAQISESRVLLLKVDWLFRRSDTFNHEVILFNILYGK